MPPTSPVAGFTANVTSGPVLLAVQFTDDSTAGSLAPITSYYWDFGDGTNSTLQNPTHTFTQIGQYTVNETVTDGNFETSSYNATITVSAANSPGSRVYSECYQRHHATCSTIYG